MENSNTNIHTSNAVADRAGIRHCGLTVSSMDRSERFYREFFGFYDGVRVLEKGPFIEKITGIPGVIVTTLKMKAPGGGLLELLEYSFPQASGRSQGINIIGCSHIALTVGNADACYANICKAGYNTISVPQLSPNGNAKVFFCKDPDGVLVEIVEEKG